MPQQELFQDITPQAARALMQAHPEAVILDVRGPQEYRSRHIPGALNLPLEKLVEQAPTLLPNKDALLLVYCQIGVRSLQASALLAGLGYRRVCHFGGIDRWPYDTVSGR